MHVNDKRIVKSLLRYPGGKSRAVSKILEIVDPNSINELVSPFFGGGSIELAYASRGVRVYGYDAFEPLVYFWQYAIKAPKLLAKEVARYHPLSRDDFYEIQNIMKNEKISKKKTAILFFVLNRSSFSGTTLSGGMSPEHKRFTRSAIDRLKQFEISNLTVENAHFEESIKMHRNKFLYCDPPYANGGALYGERGDFHKNFDHESLAKILRKRNNWLLSYNDCNLVRQLYDGYKIEPVKWSYGMNSNRTSNEVLVYSKDIKR